MAKKLSPAELKKQGEELNKSFAEIRKKQHNFAMQIGKEGIVFHIDRKKPADVLWRNAKKDGGGPKGTQGRINMNGKILELDSDDPDTVPKNLLKLAKKHFAERGLPVRIVLKGAEEEQDEDGTVEAQYTETASRSQAEDAPRARAPTARTQDVAEVSEPAVAQEKAQDTGAAGADDALRDALKREYTELEGDLEAAGTSTNKGVVKKITGLKGMFEAQIDTDIKRAGSVLSLLKSTLSAAREQAVAERRAKLEELEKGVDDLLAKLAA